MAVIETTEGEDGPAPVHATPDLVALDTAEFEETDGEDDGEMPTRSGLSQLMELLRIAIHNISYIRGIFPDNYFRDTLVAGTDVTVKKLIPKDTESRRIIDWIEQGVYDAMEKRYLETLLFRICEKEEGLPFDEFSFTFKYLVNASGEEYRMQFRLVGSRGNGAIFNSNPAESIADQIRRLIRVSATIVTSLDQIPNERTIVMKLMYYDDVTPEYYEPPLFECCPDDEDGTEIAKIFGRLCCISQRAPTLFLDSGATHHICCDKFYMKEIVPISKDKQIELFTADDASLTAVETGVIEVGNIHLSQVRYIGEDRFNVVSIGYLDKQGLLVSIVNSQVFVIDVSKAIHVGEGYRHRKNNDYILRAIKWKVKTEVELQQGTLEEVDSKSWVIDSCCARHMAGNITMLTNKKPFQKEFHTPRGIMKSTHKGSVRKTNMNLSDVLYCPANSSNLLSVGLLDSQGYRFTFYGGMCTIVYKDTLEEVGRGMLRDSDLLYYLQSLETKNLNVVHKRKRKSKWNKFD